MNLIEQMNVLKGLDDAMLQREAQAPSGGAPPYLVLSEINRRADMRKRYEGELARRKPQTTVAQDTIASLQPGGPMAAAPSIDPAAMGSGAGISAAVPGQGSMQPPGFADGGIVDFASIAKRYNDRLEGLDEDRDRARALALLAASAGMLGGGSSNTLKNVGLGINAGVQSYGDALNTIDSRESGLLKDLLDLDLAQQDQAYRERTMNDETFFAPMAGMIGDRPAYIQAGNRGSIREAAVPEGFVPQSRLTTVDLGDRYRITDTATGQTWYETKQGAPGTNYNVEGAGPDRVLTPAPGSIEAEKRAADIEAEAASRAASAQAAGIVTEDIDRAVSLIDANPAMTTGWGAALTQDLPAGPAADVKYLIETVKANASFDKLQQMREASPTGAALGPVSDFENRLLQATIGNLSLAQNAEQLKYNLARVKEIYLKIVNEGIEDPANPRAAAGAPAADDIDALVNKHLSP